MTTPLEDHMRREMRRFIVSKHMFCPITGEVLDMDKSVFILDADGDPIAAFSQGGWARAKNLAEEFGSALLADGYSVDESTVKA